MTTRISRVAVIGSGVMGSGIAAHVANAGIPVLLLDILPKDSKAPRNQIAANALKALKKSKPAAFYDKASAQMVEIGNLEDDLERVAECDLIVEAIIERLDIKRTLFEKLDNLIKDDTIIASNTSGLPIAQMVEGRSESFRKNFLVTHFFNPPRYMKLLELAVGPETSPEALERASHFGRELLGKGIVLAKDRPNFVANRIGAHALMTTIHLMLEHKLTPEDIDAMSGAPMGHPKTATFRTGDMVGLDTLVHVVDNCYESLPEDEDRDVFKAPDYIRKMIESKLLGNKTRTGFYKKSKEGIQTYDPYTNEYRPKAGDGDIRSKCKALGKEEDVAARVKKLVETDGVVGEFSWKVLSRSLAYSARRVGEISDDIAAIDEGMKWGYNWELGPFEIWDALGFEATLKRMQDDGIDLPASITKMQASGAKSFYDGTRVFDLAAGQYKERPADPREVTFEALIKTDAPVLKNNGAIAVDLGDGVLGIRFTTKANSIDPDTISILRDGIALAEKDFRGVLLSNGGDHFCVGANLFLVVMAAQQKNWDQIRGIVSELQSTVQYMKYSQVPVVAAPFGMTLGGGLELCLGADQVQAAAETYAGLVEVGVGLIPGGAGNLNLLWRALENIPAGTEYDVYSVVTQVFKNIAMANVATSAGEARANGYFRRADGVSFDRARQIYEAKQRVIGLAESGYHPPQRQSFKLPGESGIATLKMMVGTLVAGGFATEHDAFIAGKLAEVLCGGVSGASGPVTEDRILELEREAFISLCGEPKSQERMQHMLMKNKPLRN